MNVRIIFSNGDAVVWGATELEEMKAGVRPLWLGMYWPDANGDPGRRVVRVEPAGWEVDSFMRETTAGSKVTVKVGYAVPDTPRAWAWWLEGERNGESWRGAPQWCGSYAEARQAAQDTILQEVGTERPLSDRLVEAMRSGTGAGQVVEAMR